MIHDVKGVGADLSDRERAVGAASRVADVEDGLVRKLIEHGARNCEAAHARVEDADGVHGGRSHAHAHTVPSSRSSASSIVPS